MANRRLTILHLLRAFLFMAGSGIVTAAAADDNFRPFTTSSFAEIKAAHAGQEFLVGLWSVDCPPCLVELDMMGEILEDNPDLPFVLISTDPIADREWAYDFLLGFGLAQRESWMFSHSLAERLRLSIYTKLYGGLPRSYFFDADHQMQSHSGIMTRELLEQWFSQDLGLQSSASR
jgi:thiol-disulfide isomerase/thioredoxin